ncbi:mediator of RNA polymerase II transcription subunit 20 [Petromyzon marinus]|uniref:Mediator of RNA polymerase II transcription subunit 20 n=1 Tax=Petromyzon marinus TaxID=7757 RepID=A0AAJ7TLY6_PETMA|nr:mediator of RNA polymerase II transcription subunit 20 [Petromyzon marinus]
MGVTSVCQWPLADGKSIQQNVEMLAKKLELMGATKQASFLVDCEMYHPVSSTGQSMKCMYVMHNSEYPLSCFALYENGPCLTADVGFDALMLKLKGLFQNAKSNKVEARGTRYVYADFLIKLGTVTMGPSSKGVCVEVEYCPCVVPSDCWGLLQEFMQALLGPHAPVSPPTAGAGRADGATGGAALYTAADTMVQYMELFNRMRKQQGPSAPTQR